MTKHITYPIEYIKRVISDISALYYNVKDIGNFELITQSIDTLVILLRRVGESDIIWFVH